MVNFEVRRDGTVEDAVYDVDPLSDTANPFGDYAVVKIDDRGGEKFGKYSRGTALEVTINDDGQTFDRFDGYVVEARETEQSGAMPDLSQVVDAAAKMTEQITKGDVSWSTQPRIEDFWSAYYAEHGSTVVTTAVERVLENENEMISMTPTSNVSLSVGDTLTVSNQIHATDTFTFNTGLGKGFKTAGWSYSENDDKK